MAELQEVWEGQARADPLWAVLSERSKQGRRWQLDRFLATGEQAVATWLNRVADCGIEIRAGTAVDFGCGIGRLTQPLARRFEHTIGIDIAPTMLRLAEAINPYPDRVEFILNAQDDLRVIDTSSTDFVLSHITLQHMRPELAERYLAEFFRVLRPGGVMIFQLPSHLLVEEVVEGIPRHPAGRPAATRPIPLEAASADIRLLRAAEEISADREMVVRVSVQNASAADWHQCASCPLNVGNHWLSADGTEVLVQDDGRAPMPLTLLSGQKVEIDLRVLAPARPGRYILEIDLVQEGVQWFQASGGKTLRTAIDVTLGDGEPSVAPEKPYEFPELIDEVFQPPEPFEMHGIRKERVLEIVKRLGGKLFWLDEDVAGWRSYGYYVRVP